MPAPSGDDEAERNAESRLPGRKPSPTRPSDCSTSTDCPGSWRCGRRIAEHLHRACHVLTDPAAPPRRECRPQANGQPRPRGPSGSARHEAADLGADAPDERHALAHRGGKLDDARRAAAGGGGVSGACWTATGFIVLPPRARAGHASLDREGARVTFFGSLPSQHDPVDQFRGAKSDLGRGTLASRGGLFVTSIRLTFLATADSPGLP